MNDVSVIEGPGPDLDELVSEWRRIAELRGNPFVTPEWFFATASGRRRVVVVKREDGSLLGLLPLVEEPWRGIRALRFSGFQIGDRFHPVAAPGDECETVIEAIKALSEAGERRVVLDKCADGAGWLDHLGGGGTPMAFREISTASLPWIDLSGRDWDQYLSDLSKNLRSRIRRMERKLIREHGMSIRSVAEAGELETDFATLFELHDARRDQVGGTALGSERHRLQLLGFCRSALDRGWLRLRIMECDGRPVAAFLGWRLGPSYCFYQTGFDPAWGRLSVGLVSLSLAIRDAFEEGASEFDLLLGDEAYKQRLADGNRKVTTGILTRSFDVATGIARIERGLRQAKKVTSGIRAQ